LGSFFFSYLTCKLLRYLNFSQKPTERCSHETPTPTAGGISFALGFIAFVLISNVLISNYYTFQNPLVLYYIGAASLLLIVSLYDDFKPLSYRIRLLVQLVCALFLVVGGGVIESPVVTAHSDSVLFFLRLLTVLSIIALMNAANFIDGLNGLLSLPVMITLGFASVWVFFNLFRGSIINIFMHWALIAGILGFVVHNFPKGKLFMGDTGSTFLGLTLSFFALIAQQHYISGPHQHPQLIASHPETAIFNKGFVFTLLPMAFLWFDVFFTLCRRIIRGEHLAEAHRDHMFHILFDKGFGHSSVTLLYSLLTIIMGLLTFQCHIERISFITLLAVYVVLQTLFVLFVFKMPSRK
jgi:UDP-N-acetylmuramyl pentapeptide phosphotransferase/UDP-N-acetylglucosamine-1-phosphate transferase